MKEGTAVLNIMSCEQTPCVGSTNHKGVNCTNILMSSVTEILTPVFLKRQESNGCVDIGSIQNDVHLREK